MRRLLQSLIISIAVITIASPSFAGDDRKDKKWDRDKKEQHHHKKKEIIINKHPGKPFKKIMKQLDDLNDKLDELLAIGVDLGGVTQNWDKKLPTDDGPPCNSSRFTCIFPDATHPDGAAVRDNETGLVWERSPTESSNWDGVGFQCLNLPLGGRKGWRLPSANELGTLAIPADPAVVLPETVLPPGHPFLNVQPVSYWSTTTFARDPAQAYVVFFGNGFMSGTSKSIFHNRWCVRGGMNANDLYQFSPL